MSDHDPTKLRLAKALREAALEALVVRAEAGEFDDYESLHETPSINLVGELIAAGDTGMIRDLISRVTSGEFDGTKEEAEAWARTHGPADLLVADTATSNGPTPVGIRQRDALGSVKAE